MRLCHTEGMQLDVESLRTLMAVVDAGQITAAAQRLNLTQSAVSRKVQRLEQRVGRPLLVRSGRTLSPTHDGRELLADAADIVALHDRAAARLTASDVSGRVRVGAIEEVPLVDLTEIFGDFNRLHPAATVELVVEPTDLLVQRLDAGDLDVILLQVTDDSRRREDRVLWSDRLRWYTHPHHLYDEGPVPIVSFGERCFYGPLSEPLLDAAGIEYWHSISLTSTAAVVSAIEAGLGVGVLSARVATESMVAWPTGDQLPTLQSIYQVVRARSADTSKAIGALSQAIVDRLSDPALDEAM